MLIIVTSFLPIFFLGAREGRLFNPLAFSKTFAMAFSTLLTLFLLPAIIAWVFKRHIPPADGPTESRFVRAYRRALVGTIRYRYAFVGLSALLFVVSTVVMVGFQKDYMPEMEEGSILYMPTTLPGLPSKEAGWILQQMDKKLKAFPEVERVFGKLGRADTATDPAPVEMIETTVTLKPRSQWRPGMTKDRLVSEMNDAMQVVGYVNSWTQPINTRVMMQDTGIQTPVGIKVKGPELATIEDVARQVEGLLKDLPGTQAVIAERISRGYFVDARLDLERMAAHGVTVEEAMPTVQFGLGGDNVVGIRQSDKTIVPLAIQYSPEYVDTLAKVRNTPVITADGRAVSLADVADVAVREAPEMIRNDNGDLAGYIYVYLDNITAPEYVDRARAHLQQQLELPAGYVARVDRALSVRRGGTLEAAHCRADHPPHHVRVAGHGVPVGGRQLADHALSTICPRRWRTAPVVPGLLDDDGRHHRLCLAVRRGDPDWHHHDRVHPRGARQPAGGTDLYGSGRRRIGGAAAAQADDGGDDGAGTAADHVGERVGNGHHAANRHAHLRGHDHVDHLRAVPHSLPVRDWRGHSNAVAATLWRGSSRPCRHRGPSVRRRAAMGLLLACLAASCSNEAPGAGVTQGTTTGAGMEIQFRSEAEPPTSGDNTFEVIVAKDGVRVSDAQVNAALSMPAMPSMNMPEMHTSAKLEPAGDGRYRGTARLSMAGTWNVRVTVTLNGQDLGTKTLSIVAK